MRDSSCTRCVLIKRINAAAERCPAPALGDQQMPIGERRDLGQMGDADDLAMTTESRQPATDLKGRLAADPGVDLVEDHAGGTEPGRQHDFKGQHDPRQLAAGRALGQRP